MTPIPTRPSTPESGSSQSNPILANLTATKKTYNPTFQEQSQFPLMKKEKSPLSPEKLARMLLIYRRDLIKTIQQLGTLLRKKEYDSTDVLLHLLGRLTDTIIRYTETFRVIAPLAPFMNDQIIKDQLQRSNESELLEKLIRDLLLSPILWDTVLLQTTKTDLKSFGDFCEMTESLSQYPTELDTSSTGNVLNLLKSSPTLQEWNGNPTSTQDLASNNSDSMSLDD